MYSFRTWAVLLACLSFGACTKPRVEYSTDTEKKNGLVFMKGESRPFTGIAINRVIGDEVHYENGVPIKTASLRQAAPASMFSAEINRRLIREGGKTGDVQISLIWQTTDDLDLHCRDPHGRMIYFGNRRSPSGGELDVDMNVQPPFSTEPVENIVWAQGRAPRGEYTIHVKCYRHRRGNPLPIRLTVAVKARDDVREMHFELNDQEKLEVYRFSID